MNEEIVVLQYNIESYISLYSEPWRNSRFIDGSKCWGRSVILQCYRVESKRVSVIFSHGQTTRKTTTSAHRLILAWSRILLDSSASGLASWIEPNLSIVVLQVILVLEQRFYSTVRGWQWWKSRLDLSGSSRAHLRDESTPMTSQSKLSYTDCRPSTC